MTGRRMGHSGKARQGDPHQELLAKRSPIRQRFSERCTPSFLTSMTLRFLTLIVLTGLFSTALFGQNSVFTGHVTDSSGAVIPKAQIVVHNQETGVDTATTTTKSGDLPFPTEPNWTGR